MMRPSLHRSRSELSTSSARLFRNVVVRPTSQKKKTTHSQRQSRRSATSKTSSIPASDVRKNGSNNKLPPSRIPRYPSTSKAKNVPRRSILMRSASTAALSTRRLPFVSPRRHRGDQGTASTAGHTSGSSISSRSHTFETSDDELSLQNSVRQAAIAMKSGKELSLDPEENNNEDTVMMSNTKDQRAPAEPRMKLASPSIVEAIEETDSSSEPEREVAMSPTTVSHSSPEQPNVTDTEDQSEAESSNKHSDSAELSKDALGELKKAHASQNIEAEGVGADCAVQDPPVKKEKGVGIGSDKLTLSETNEAQSVVITNTLQTTECEENGASGEVEEALLVPKHAADIENMDTLLEDERANHTTLELASDTATETAHDLLDDEDQDQIVASASSHPADRPLAEQQGEDLPDDDLRDNCLVPEVEQGPEDDDEFSIWSCPFDEMVADTHRASEVETEAKEESDFIKKEEDPENIQGIDIHEYPTDEESLGTIDSTELESISAGELSETRFVLVGSPSVDTQTEPLSSPPEDRSSKFPPTASDLEELRFILIGEPFTPVSHTKPIDSSPSSSVSLSQDEPNRSLDAGEEQATKSLDSCSEQKKPIEPSVESDDYQSFAYDEENGVEVSSIEPMSDDTKSYSISSSEAHSSDSSEEEDFARNSRQEAQRALIVIDPSNRTHSDTSASSSGSPIRIEISVRTGSNHSSKPPQASTREHPQAVKTKSNVLKEQSHGRRNAKGRSRSNRLSNLDEETYRKLLLWEKAKRKARTMGQTSPQAQLASHRKSFPREVIVHSVDAKLLRENSELCFMEGPNRVHC